MCERFQLAKVFSSQGVNPAQKSNTCCKGIALMSSCSEKRRKERNSISGRDLCNRCHEDEALATQTPSFDVLLWLCGLVSEVSAGKGILVARGQPCSEV